MSTAEPPMTAECRALADAYAALSRNDVEGFTRCFDPEIERIEFLELPIGGTYRGIGAVKVHVAEGRGTWAEGSCTPARFIVAGDKVVVVTHVHVRLKDATDWIDAQVGDVFTFRDGKVIQFRSFVNARDAIGFAGAND